MSKISPLTTGLIEDKPETAVTVLADMNPDDAASFLQTLTTRHAVSVLSRTSAWLSSDLIPKMSTVSGAAILADLEYQTTASIMRVVSDADRQRLLDALPKRLREDLLSTLTYPLDTVGAKMSTAIVVLKSDRTVAEAVAELRRIKRSRTGLVFVVDDARRLLGVANAGDLLQLPNESALSAVIDRTVVAIPARARLETVRSRADWDEYAQLPVVNRKKMVIGALSRKVFRQSGPAGEPQSKVVKSRPILGSMAGTFLASVVGLLQVLTDAEIKVHTSDEEPPQPDTGGTA